MKKKVLLFIILLVAIVFRFNNLNWDSDFHLHPDERFLTMVGNAVTVPSDLTTYLNPGVSSLNPANVGYTFFVYGTFPLVFSKILAVVSHNDTYNLFTIQGRFLSALADLLIVFVVYKIAELLFPKKERIKYWAAFLYAIAVLPIQLSHFFAVDTFLTLFILLSFYFLLRPKKYILDIPYLSIGLSAFFFGLALASKVTAVFILPLNFFLMIFKSSPERSEGSRRSRKNTVIRFLAFLQNDIWIFFCFTVIAYITVRVAAPYYFESSKFVNLTPNRTFMDNLQTLKSLDNKDAWFPPGVQWIHKTPVLFSIKNLAIFGVGLPYFLLILIGMAQIMFKKGVKDYMLYIVLLWTLGLFLYQSVQLVQAMRYFIIIYPFLAIFAAIGIASLNSKRLTLNVLLIFALLVWPVAFSSIYLRDNSRVAASKWIYQNVPSGSRILSEIWDDPLPLPLNNPHASEFGKQYTSVGLPVFDPDTPEKWAKMNELLQNSDYYILSSNRGWGSIPTVPERYPKMTEFYNDLFAGKLAYKKVAEFHSYPSILGIEFPDQWADESFTVYDHPQVIIFKKT